MISANADRCQPKCDLLSIAFQAVRRIAETLIVFAVGAGSVRTLAAGEDPFADVVAAPQVVVNAAALSEPQWTDNLLLRKEVYLLFATSDETDGIMSRLSAGFEVQKRFSTATRTLASVDYQGRLVYRDRMRDTSVDPMGHDASPWEYETHNAYLDFYNLFGGPGRFNLRCGYFYQPFGLNQQTDTHGTILQLSNDRLFGSDRDGQAILYGTLTDDLDYTVGYLLGAGPDFKLAGQTGMGIARVALNSDWLFRRGLEVGMSVAAGERVSEYDRMRMESSVTNNPAMARRADTPARNAMAGSMIGNDPLITTFRAGLDVRKRMDSTIGPFTLTGEAAMGTDDGDPILSGLTQADWLNPGRRWGVAAHVQYFRREGSEEHDHAEESRATFVLTRYFRNDVGNASLHWVALAVAQDLQPSDGPDDTLAMVHYYRYW